VDECQPLAGGGPAQQHRIHVSVRAGCTSETARVSGDGIRGQSGPAGAVTAVEVACRDGVGARQGSSNRPPLT
jgi:hypothetical protein